MRTFLGTLFLRIAIAFALLYPAISSFINPDKWAAAMPQLVSHFVAVKTFMIIFAGYEFLFALLILIKPDPFAPCIIVFLISAALAGLSFRDFSVVYPNMTLAFAALSMGFLGKIRG